MPSGETAAFIVSAVSSATALYASSLMSRPSETPGDAENDNAVSIFSREAPVCPAEDGDGPPPTDDEEPPVQDRDGPRRERDTRGRERTAAEDPEQHIRDEERHAAPQTAAREPVEVAEGDADARSGLPLTGLALLVLAGLGLALLGAGALMRRASRRWRA